ncbi:MAG: chromosome partitioning protein ParB [Paracoccus denitrificans]|nr:MAG: chromosome partitioning protein ParB [Paracoccus denitrificans]PZO84283.1 MAG: chromosome partitioning protein ParB [Paracoccus denitrificans]
MAKRRRLPTPSTDDLSRIEEEFRRETSGPLGPGFGAGVGSGGRGGMAPIAQIAAESAAMGQMSDPDAREARARDQGDAARLREAEEQGLLIVEVAVDQIEDGAMIRDRLTMDEAELLELRLSIAANGQRLPIEVFPLTTPPGQEARYGLLSGYRRLQAVRGLRELTGDPKYDHIRALIRPPKDADHAFVAMVEENEVRAELSHFERGRIAVIAADQGAFANVEDAVNRLYATGSKAKRSKVRSFALIFEELGDMLRFPEGLTEKRGLRLSAALRGGGEGGMRKALAASHPECADEEWDVIEPVLAQYEATPRDARKGGRPRKAPAKTTGWINDQTIRTTSGITLTQARDGRAFVLRLEGAPMNAELMESLMAEVQSLLER